MSTLKVDTIAANSAATISISSPIAMTQTASITGSLSTSAISSTGTISTTGELDGATLDISGNGVLDGQLNVGSLLVAGNLSASGILVDGEELRPHVFAFGSFSGSTLAGGKNCTAVIDSSGTLTVTFTTAAPDANYVVLSSTKDQASPVQVSSKSTASFEISSVPTAGVDFLVVALLGSQGEVTAALPTVSLDNLTDVDLTGLDDNEILVYDLASGKFKPEPAGTGSGSVTEIVAGTGLTGGTINSSGTIAHQAVPTTGLTSVGFPSAISIDTLGHIASLTGDATAGDARDTLGLGDSATKTVGTTSGTVCAGDDSRLSDPRTPTAHTQALSTITDAGTSASLDVASSGDATSSQVVKGNDSRLTDARTPVAHSANLVTSDTLGVDRIPTITLAKVSDAGTAAAAATGDFEASGSIATHNAITTAHGISAFGATLVDDADATAARTTLGAAGTNHSHSIGQITGAGTAAALDVGITSNDVLQVSTSGVTANEFLRIEALGTKAISRTAAEVLSDIGAATSAQGTKADSALQDVVSDTTPQLGGNLDVQARTITTSTTNGSIVIDPPGTGFLQVEGTTNPGKIRLMCEAGTHGVGLISPAHSAGANYDLVLPTATGSANQLLKTDGSGNLGWTDPTAVANNVTSPAMTSVSAGSITGVIKCSQAQYDAITPVSTILYVIV